MFTDNQQVQGQSTGKIKVPGGYIFYALFLPVIGLFLEKYAYSAIVAIIMWALVIILMPLSCYLDKRMLEKHEVETIGLGKTFLFAPLYIYKRQKLVRGDPALCIVIVVLCIGAILTNGFVKGSRVTADVVPDIVRNSPITQLDNFSGSSVNTIDECVGKYLGKEAEWAAEKTDYGFMITAVGTHGSKLTEIKFRLEFDGFTYHSFRIFEITENGEELDTDGRKRVLNDCFIDYKKTADADSSSAGESSSEVDQYD
ncbi:MAG: hypothetical protein J5956_12225 [Ruminococcus sp.]|nr:hypothetical protein [Ruminococcus sp.]